MYLGLDLGTTNVKALVVDQEGRVVSEGAAPVERFYVDQEGVEQDIDAIWQSACAAVCEAVAKVDASRILAMGISSQGAALQLLGREGKPLGRVISWLDGRGRRYDEQLTRRLGEAYFVEHLGRTSSTMAPGQILRLREEMGPRFDEVGGIGWVGDLIVQRFCGRRAHDATSLSIAMLYNPRLDRADPDVLGLLGLREAQLPDLVPATVPAGTLTPEATARTGLPTGIPVSAAVHDQYAGSLGAGSVEPGDVCLGTGTAWAMVANTTRLADPVTRGTFVCPHPVPGIVGQMLSMTNGGSAVDWILEVTGRSPGDLDAVMASVPAGSGGLSVWPLLTPSAEAEGQRGRGGRITGITLAHTPDHLLRAVVEGLACELARHLRMFDDAGLPLDRLVVCGGAAAGHVTPQIIADVTGRLAACVVEPSVSPRGAAVIARALVEPDRGLANLSRRLAPATRVVEPGPDAALYRDLLARYLEEF